MDYWGSSPALCHKFFGKKGGVVFKPCIAECFWSDLYVFSKLGDTNSEMIEEDLAPLDLKESIRKTRQALDIAYAGFDNAIENDLIDSYIYEINALQKRYQHLTELAASQPVRQEKTLYQHSPIRALVSHVFG